MNEFKVGDRVRLEGVISRLWGDGGAAVNFTGSDEETGVTREEMAHATLIEPARKDAPQEQVMELDLSKPIQLKDTKSPVNYLAKDHMDIIFVQEVGSLKVLGLDEYDLENTPEPKRAGRMKLCALWSGWAAEGTQIGVYFDNGSPHSSEVVGRAVVTYTKGEGWSVEEVK